MRLDGVVLSAAFLVTRNLWLCHRKPPNAAAAAIRPESAGQPGVIAVVGG